MGFITERPSKEPATLCRAVLGAFMMLMILLVVLLTCLLELPASGPSNPAMPPPQTSSSPAVPLPGTSSNPAMPPPQTSSSPAVPLPGTSPNPAMPPPQTSPNPAVSVSGASSNPTVPPTFAMTPLLDPCPSKLPGLVPFPTNDYDVILSNGISYILMNNVTVNTITITNGASLTVADEGYPITLRTKYILIATDGALLIGSESCRHRSPLEIVLYGLSTDPEQNVAFGQKFIGANPSASIEIHGPWKLSWTFINTTIQPGATNFVVTVHDDATSWNAGDRVVVASSDYEMLHAEEFDLVACSSCSPNQIMIKGPAQYLHLGTVLDSGVDVRAEIGILTRNIKIRGEMQTECYADNKCDLFDYDTHGGVTEVLYGTRVARFQGIELMNMGQQRIPARYPIHFHQAFQSYGNYAKQLSIHHCFSRCVTIHSTMSILVEDVVGYDTLGHCFFLEDGNEVNNTLVHNLGLVTRFGTLITSDRDDFYCVNLTANPAVYIPDAAADCGGVASFWIPHPANNLTNNAAGGSEYGFFYVFPRVPTGPSAGLLPPFDAARSPLGAFVGNRAHSNNAFGFFMDRGEKVDLPSANDPRDFLALIDQDRYQPHVDRNLSLPRAPAHLLDFTGYTNNVGMFVRGGDIWISNARLADNDVAVTMFSDKSLPYDEGSHQELVNSIVVGKSPNNSDWSNRSVPCVGVEIVDGPILIANNLFDSFPTDPNRLSYAIGFTPNNTGQCSPANTIGANTFTRVDTKLFFGRNDSYFGDYNLDGDLTQIVYDESGNITLSTPVYAMRSDYPLVDNDTTCAVSQGFKYCTPRDFGQLYVNVSSKNVQFAIEDVTMRSGRLILQGCDLYDVQHPTTIQFQPVLIANHTYRINWLNGTAPSSLNFSMLNFEQYSSLSLELCYPPSTSFLRASLYVLDQVTHTVTVAGNVSMSPNYSTIDQTFGSEAQYFWNATAGLLRVKLQVLWTLPPNSYSYCAPDGCHFFNIVANVTDPTPPTCI